MQKSEKRIIVGLGNPGNDYARTKHNAGFMFVDDLAQRAHLTFTMQPKCNALVAEGDAMILVKPQTFMNLSGASVAALLSYYKLPIGNLVVAHDDTDIPLGEFKLQKNRGAAGHNGVISIIEHIGTQDFTRVRIGVRPPEVRSKAVDFVLRPSTKKELEVLHEVFKKIQV